MDKDFVNGPPVAQEIGPHPNEIKKLYSEGNNQVRRQPYSYTMGEKYSQLYLWWHGISIWNIQRTQNNRPTRKHMTQAKMNLGSE